MVVYDDRPRYVAKYIFFVVPGMQLIVVEYDARFWVAMTSDTCFATLPWDFGYETAAALKDNVTTVPARAWAIFLKGSSNQHKVQTVVDNLMSGMPTDPKDQGLLFAPVDIIRKFLEFLRQDVDFTMDVIQQCHKGYTDFVQQRWKLRNKSLARCWQYSGNGRQAECEENLCFYQPLTYSCTSGRFLESLVERHSAGLDAVGKLLGALPANVRAGYASLANKRRLEGAAQYLPSLITRLEKAVDSPTTSQDSQETLRTLIKEYWNILFSNLAGPMELQYMTLDPRYKELMLRHTNQARA